MDAPDPIARFHEAYARAREHVPLADAVALATADASGRPSVRFVLLKGADARGFSFYTNLDSRKARDLRDNPRAALCVYWDPIGVQIRVEGAVTPVSADEADAYFATRPRGSQLGAWASRQSQPLASRDELMARVAEYERRFGDGPVPRPDYWSGFRIAAERIELWSRRDDRLHDRFLYTRDGSRWNEVLLQP